MCSLFKLGIINNIIRTNNIAAIIVWLYLLASSLSLLSECVSYSQQNRKLDRNHGSVSRFRYARYGDADNCGKRKRNVENRKCFRQCTSDLDCRGSKRRCLCDGECGLSCVRITTACTKVGEFKNGMVSYHPDNYFGSQMVYECASGYTLLGNKIRICEGDGWWSGSSPICVLEIFCDSPESILNAIPNVQVNNQSKYKIGTEVEYQCDIGYTSLEDQNKIVCLESGKWSELKFKCSKISCGKPDDIENGIFKGDDFFYSGVIEYKCMPGYRLRNGDYLRECDLDGKWSGRKPTCEALDCGEPPQIPNTIATYNSTLFGSRATYNCISDLYKLVDGLSQVICMANGRWHEASLPKCIEKTCSLDSKEYFKNIYNITSLTPGSELIENNVYRINTLLKFSCVSGYELDGPIQVGCYPGEYDGYWGEKPPICRLEAVCPILDPPPNGLITSNRPIRLKGYPINTTLEFSCVAGFKLIGSKFHFCKSSGSISEWVGERTDCILDTTTTTTTSTLTTTTSADLNKNFQEEKSTQQVDNVYDIIYERCKIDMSSMLISYSDIALTQSVNDFVFTNASIGDTIENDSMVAYICRNNNITTYTAKCINGTLFMQQNCNELSKSFKSCSPPPKIPFGYNKYGSSSHGSKALYQCFNGYELTKGHGELKCSNGEWVGSIPVCSKINCGFPGILANGKIFYIGTLSEYTYQPYMNTVGQNKQIRYECDKDYKLVGPNGSTCINGNWKPNLRLVKCVKETITKTKMGIEEYQDSNFDDFLNDQPNGKVVLYKSQNGQTNVFSVNELDDGKNLTQSKNENISTKSSTKLRRLKKHRSKKANNKKNSKKKKDTQVSSVSLSKSSVKASRNKSLRRANHFHENKNRFDFN